MAAGGGNDLIMMQVKKNGATHLARISRSLFEMINSPDCDPKLRQEVIDAATATEPSSSSALSESFSATPLNSNSGSSKNVDTPEPSTSYSTGQFKEEELLPDQLIHLWTSSEEKALISVRGDFDEQFNKNQRHDVLWKEVTKKMISLGINVTNVQVENKWNKLKKDYRKAVDENNNTGNNPAKFKYFEDFNRIFGNRTSTKPMVVFDTGNIRPLTPDTDSHSASLELSKKQKKEPVQRSTQKSPNDKIMEKLEQQNKETVNEIRKQHDEKMERFDRFLNIFEKSVTKKNPDQ